jgi:UDP-sugar transporter A1/2/3
MNPNHSDPLPLRVALQHELLLVAELIKIVYSAWMISGNLPEGTSLLNRLKYLVASSQKMFVLALIYGAMNILSFVSLRNISAGMFTIFAQCKILTTASFSTIVLERKYSWTKWRALFGLMMGVLLFSEPIWGDPEKRKTVNDANVFIGTAAVLIEVTLSGFASIYFEKVIKTDPLQLNIWERNFQLALGSFPVYLAFIAGDGGGQAGLLGGWSWIALLLACLGAAGGLLVALSIKHGDSILKTLATTGAIILSSLLDHFFLGGPLTPSMMIAGAQVIIAIINYTFDATPPSGDPNSPSERPGTPSKDLNRGASRDDEEERLLDIETSSLPHISSLPGLQEATGSAEYRPAR